LTDRTAFRERGPACLRAGRYEMPHRTGESSMTNRTLKIAVIALVVLGFAAAVVASTVGGDTPQTHTMPGGEVMTGPMEGR
jgi:hypothetical protein